MGQRLGLSRKEDPLISLLTGGRGNGRPVAMMRMMAPTVVVSRRQRRQQQYYGYR